MGKINGYAMSTCLPRKSLQWSVLPKPKLLFDLI